MISPNEFMKATETEPLMEVNSADDVQWDDVADLVVVGFGAAGVSASLEGRERGASVIAIDRFAGGGATAYSGGVLYASDTPIQKEAGYNDSAEEMSKYLRAENAPVSDETLQRFCKGSRDDFAWVSGHGVPYKSTLYSGKGTYPPEGKFLYFSGNEKTPKFAELAKPAPRGHRAEGRSYTGNVFYAALSAAALKIGVKLLQHSPVKRLVVDKTGTVIGVEINQVPIEFAEKHQSLYNKVSPHSPLAGKQADKAIAECRIFEKKHGVRRRIRARQGVILSSGGFVHNYELMRKFRPDVAQCYSEILRLGSMGCDGSGIALGVSAGANTELMGNAFVGRTVSPPETYLNGVMVNLQGKRFVTEDAYLSLVGNRIAAQSDRGSAYLIVDRHAFWQALKEAIFIGRGMFMFFGIPALLNILFGGTRRGSNLRTLARKCNIDPDNLEQTVSLYNERIKSGVADDLGKLAVNMAPIGSGPYYALNMSTHNKFGFTPVFTLGGLKVDESTGGVLREDGSHVRGLYAAGRTAVGLCSAGYMSGMSLADCVFSGRRSAAAAIGKKNS
jgi:3-oxo-5alpha-steroid 4-dehydrogenase